jgi:protein-cysteine N-palmitoyltransferase HHAT
MGALSYLRGVYDLDTLDTRFTTPATVPYKAVLDARRHDVGNGSANGGARQEDIGLSKPDKRAQPSKWNTPEFYLYYLAFVTLVPYMFWIAYDVSRRKSKTRKVSCQRGLR